MTDTRADGIVTVSDAGDNRRTPRLGRLHGPVVFMSLVALGGFAGWYLHRYFCENATGGPGPIFMEGQYTTDGYDSSVESAMLCDADGTWLFDDLRRNLLVFGVTGDPDGGEYQHEFAYGHATLFIGERYEAQIPLVQDAIVIVTPDGHCSLFYLHAGGARAFSGQSLKSRSAPLLSRLAEFARAIGDAKLQGFLDELE